MKKLKLSLICTLAALLCCALFAFLGVHAYTQAQNKISTPAATEEITAPELNATATAKTSVDIPTFASTPVGSTTNGRTVTVDYDGEVKLVRVGVGVFENSPCVATGNNQGASPVAFSGKDPGTYTCTVSLRNTTTHQWSDGTTTPKTYTLIIRQLLTIPSIVAKPENSTVSGRTVTVTYTGATFELILGAGVSDDSPYTVTGNNGGTSPVRFSGKDPGTYTCTFTLKDTTAYVWSDGTTTPKAYSLVIQPNATNFTVDTISSTAYTYDGSAKKPEPTIKYGNTTLTKGTHYTLSYENNINAGKATLIITGKGTYGGEKKVNFTINQRDIKNASFGTIDTQYYTGSQIKPEPTITDKVLNPNVTLRKNTDFTFSYENNVNAGTATIKITGTDKGNYKGTTSTTFAISGKSVKGATISEISEFTYDGTAKKPIATVTLDGVTLSSGTDFDFSYESNVNAGTAKLIITGKGNYAGTDSKDFTINARNISNAEVATIAAQPYTGSAKTPVPTLTDLEKTLTNNTDYTLEYDDNVNVGTAKITITGKGNYTGTKEVTFSISARSIANASVDPISAYTYDGNAKEPVPTVTDGSKTLAEGVDYSIKYENNVNVGTAKIILSGMGNYNGTKEVNFTIQAPTVKDATVTLSQTTYTYDGTAKTPRVTSVSVANLTLKEGVDYSVSYSSNINAGTAKVIITGAGDYDGTQEVTFTINPADISSATVSGLKIQYTYTGSPIEPTITVSLDGKDLVENTDYLVAYTNNTDVGSATVTVTGSRNYTGTLTDGFTIVSASIATATVSGVNTSYEYTGSAINPVPVVTWNGIVLVKDKDYSVTYGTNTDLGDGTVTITGLVNFNGTINKTFTITPADISTAQISGIDSNYTYTGTALTPAPTVTFGTVTLSNNDYTVTYTNNINKGTATLTVTGKGNYTGTVSTTFDIDEADLSGAAVEGVSATYEYTGSAITPEPVVKFNGAALVKGTDYTVAYTNNVNVGTATITITGIGNFELSLTETFGITEKDLSSATVEGYDASYTYTGTAIAPTVTVKLDGVTLTLTTEYTVAYTNNTSVGTATITVTGNGNYTGTATATFEITGADITNASLEGVNASYPYTGSDIQPTVTVKLDGATLTLTTDYTVAYSDNIDVGTATVTVTGTGNFTGTASTTFEITKATPTVTVEFTNYDGTSVRYAGTAIPDIDYTATFGGSAITGTLKWTGNILVSGVTDYGWEFVPDNGNLDKVTGSKFVNVVAPNIASVTVKWKNGTQPDIYTSTTLEQVKAYLKVEATLTDGTPFGSEILAGAYRLAGSWTGDETKPSKGGTYSLQVYLKDFPTVPPAILEGVVYQDVKLTGITYEVKDGQTLTTEYEGLDKFDTSKITVYASYNDGREPVEINLSTGRSGYTVVYADGHDCLWVGDDAVTLSYTEGTETKICKIENLSVEKKVFDTDGITFNDRTVTYTGKDFTLTASGFSLGNVSYTYVKKVDGEPDEALTQAKATKAGVYAVTAKFSFTEQKYIVNYEAIEDITKTLTIEKAKYEDEIVLPSVSVDYDNGKPLGDSVKVKNLPLGVTVTYTYKDEDGNAVAKDQIKNAGNYTVTVSFGVDEENYEPIAPITATFTVNKLDPKVSPTVGGSLTSGTTLSDLALTGGKNEISGTFAWEDASQTLKEGRNICWYTFTPDDTTNYNQVRSYFEWDVAGEVKEGLSTGALVGITIAAVIAVILISVVALVIAIKARKNSDDDGFYDEVTEADLAKY